MSQIPSEFKTLSDITSPSVGVNFGAITPIFGANYITEATLTKQVNDETISFKLIPWFTTDVVVNSPFVSLSFKESLVDGCIYGSMIVEDIRNWTDEFAFTGKEQLIIKIILPGYGKVEDVPIEFKFHIIEMKTITDDAVTTDLYSHGERLSHKRLYFVSSEIFLPEYNETVLEENDDFVGWISNSDSEETTPEEGLGVGLINKIFDIIDSKSVNIDKSGNGIWLKNDNIAYPWMKRRGQMRLSSLLSYVATSTTNVDSNPYYFCWHDRNGWNFKDLGVMILPNGEQIDPVDGFFVTIDETNPNSIKSIQVISEYNYDSLLDNNALICGYIRIDPNWQNPYADFTNHYDAMVEKEIIYEYGSTGAATPLVEKHPLISKKDKNLLSTAKTKKNKLKPSSRIDDEIYGYHNKNYSNTPFFEGKVHGGQWDVYGNTMSGPWSTKSWQPQFDSTDLDFAKFKIIHEKIRKPLMNKRGEYAHKKNIKRKWEVFRCAVCCHEDGALGSTADKALFQNPGAIGGATYNMLFGPTGMFADMDQEYKLSAAGSFTDLLNYDAGNTFNERGLTQSYDLTKEPYSQSIGQFFNLVGPDAPNEYIQHVIKRAQDQYQIIIDQITSRMDNFIKFNNLVEDYKKIADDLFVAVQIDQVGDPKRDIVAPNKRPIDLLQGYKFVSDAIIGEVVTDWPISSYEFGMVPHSSIPTNRGIGQVVFESGVGCNGGNGVLSFGESSFGSPTPPESEWCCHNDPNGTHGCHLVDAENGGCGVNGTLFSSQVECLLSGCEGSIPGAWCCHPSVGCYDMITHPDYPPCSGEIFPNAFSCFASGCQQEQKWCCNSEYGFCNGCSVDDPVGSGWMQLNDCLVACQSTSSLCWTCDPELMLGPDEGLGCQISTACDQPGTYNTKIECSESCIPPNEIFCGYLCQTTTDGQSCFLISAESLNVCNDAEQFYSNLGFGWHEDIVSCRSHCINITTGGGGIGPSTLPTENDIIKIDPNCFVSCSTDPIIRGFIKHTTKESVSAFSQIYAYAAPYLWDETIESGDWSFHDYGTESGLIPGVPDATIINTTKECLFSGGCYNTTCLSSVALEVLRRTCIAEAQLLLVEKTLIESLKTMVVGYEEKWKDHYKTWYDRNAFFFSKKPGKSIFSDVGGEGRTLAISSPLSLFNIKTITRKEIRGSRYEIFAKSKGITGASAGEWAYDVFFGGASGNTAHPYYDQGYATGGSDSFITSREPHAWYGVSDVDNTDDPTSFIDGKDFGVYGPEFRGNEYVETSIIHIGRSGGREDLVNVDLSKLKDYGNAQSDISSSDSASFAKAFNFYNTNGKKPPNVKKEEITSYVRVEFSSPIGMDRINEFPDGFVRDAGIEYFLPYIVQLTPGPMGRQSVKYNSAVIGMDPYGFDVAVKKIKDDIPVNRKLQGIDKGNNYQWWNHDTGSVLSKTPYLSSDYNGMDLWPEIGFETDYPYYSYDASQEDLHGGGYDMDFHMGGGYYFENDSQNWAESLYHYGMSSKKQFDPLYRTSVVGSYILPNSYRKLKPHRSWWSMFIPRNLFIPIRFANMFQPPNTKARDLFGGKAIMSLSANYWRTWYGSEFDDWITLNSSVKGLMSTLAPNLSFHVNIGDNNSSINPHNDQDAMGGYFKDSLMHYLAGSYNLYRPSLIVEDLWKYDVSGETEYGLITPPVDTEYDFFDRNFAMQFTVFSRSSRTCEDIGLKCINPNGIVKSAAGCTFDPYCNCPALDRIPKESEPTYLELYKLYQGINECKLILDNLGEDHLGCEWSDPTSTCSCNCPEQGDMFASYLAYTRTYATFWSTPDDTQIKRNAFINQLESQKITITIPPSAKVTIGSIVEVINPTENLGNDSNAFKRISGRWLVSEISHLFFREQNYNMQLTLVRDGLHYSLDDEKRPIGILLQ